MSSQSKPFKARYHLDSHLTVKDEWYQSGRDSAPHCSTNTTVSTGLHTHLWWMHKVLRIGFSLRGRKVRLLPHILCTIQMYYRSQKETWSFKVIRRKYRWISLWPQVRKDFLKDDPKITNYMITKTTYRKPNIWLSQNKKIWSGRRHKLEDKI